MPFGQNDSTLYVHEAPGNPGSFF